MTGVLSLVREPVRLSLRVWELGLSSAASAARLGLELLDPPAPPPPYRPPPQPEAAPEPEPAPAPRRDAPPPVPDELIPDHVDEEPVLVAEVAEEGAADGAGPELNVDEPWDGYRRMNAAEIRDRLTAGSPAVAAAVQLYEQTHKSRRSVLDAAERALRGRPPR